MRRLDFPNDICDTGRWVTRFKSFPVFLLRSSNKFSKGESNIDDEV